jgi:hypothetical protein
MGVRTPDTDIAEPTEYATPRPTPAWSAAFTTGALVGVALLLNVRPVHYDEMTIIMKALARIGLPTDALMTALALKILSAVLVGIAAAFFTLAMACRYGDQTAVRSALVFALGTTVAISGLGLTRYAIVLVLSCVALFLLSLSTEGAEHWAARAPLPLTLVLSVDPWSAGLVMTVILGIIVRWPKHALFCLLWALPGAVLAATVFPLWLPMGGSSMCGAGHAALLVSPQGGLLVFAPVTLIAAIGALRALAIGERFLPLTLSAAVCAHWLIVGCFAHSLAGIWGFLGLVPALPFLLFFLPDGLIAMPRLGWGLAALSMGIQMAGAFGGVFRQSPSRPEPTALWAFKDGPLARLARERAFVVTVPFARAGHVVLREHRLVLFGPKGSRVSFERGEPMVIGTEITLRDFQLLGAARVLHGRLVLRESGDGFFLRVPVSAHARQLELRILGSGRGVLTIAERTFYTDEPRLTRHTLSSSFRIAKRYHYPDSGGDEIVIGLLSGEAEMRAVMLVGPSEPDAVLALGS